MKVFAIIIGPNIIGIEAMIGIGWRRTNKMDKIPMFLSILL
jgi:hypothetical protein